MHATSITARLRGWENAEKSHPSCRKANRENSHKDKSRSKLLASPVVRRAVAHRGAAIFFSSLFRLE